MHIQKTNALATVGGGAIIVASLMAPTAYGVGVPPPSPPQSPPTAEGFTQALVSGRPNVQLRPRYESVDEDNSKNNANAYTMRSIVGYTSKRWKAFWTKLEGEHVSHLNDTDYFDTTNFNKAQTDSLVADPENTEVNQAYVGIHWTDGPDFFDKTQSRVGRQRFTLRL